MNDTFQQKTDVAPFEDPLENYDYKQIEDPVERALVEESVMRIQHEPVTIICPETPVSEAISILAELDIACLLIGADDKLEGLFSERDVLKKVAHCYDEVKNLPIRELMTVDPVFVYTNDCSAKALCLMATYNFRHAPVLDLDGNIAGIISPIRIATFLEAHFD